MNNFLYKIKRFLLSIKRKFNAIMELKIIKRLSNYNVIVFIDDGIKYTNQNSNHSYIWLYKKTNQ
jgi:hypothetical protein